MPPTDRDTTETILRANGLTAAALGLRFDRTALRVLERVRGFVEETAPAGVGVLMTLTAPIRLPGRTVEGLKAAIGARLAEGSAGEDQGLVVCGNGVRLRVLTGVVGVRFVGFVHNPSSPAQRLLDLAEGWVRGPSA